MANEILLIAPEKKPLWKTIAAVVIFTAMFIVVIANSFNIFNESPTFKLTLQSLNGSFIPLWLFLAIQLLQKKSVAFDFKNDNIILTYFIGPVSHKKTAKIPELEYVAVFKNGRNLYEVNLWYKGNRHYKLDTFQTSDNAFDFASSISKKLNLDLLDSTERGNSNWINATIA